MFKKGMINIVKCNQAIKKAENLKISMGSNNSWKWIEEYSQK